MFHHKSLNEKTHKKQRKSKKLISRNITKKSEQNLIWRDPFEETLNRLTDGFRVKTGVKQGSILSSFLFTLVIDWLMTNTTKQNERRYSMDRKTRRLRFYG